MPSFTAYSRTFATSDVLAFTNNNQSRNITKPSDVSSDPTILWIRIPDTSEGTDYLMQYDWDLDTWTDVTPE